MKSGLGVGGGGGDRPGEDQSVAETAETVAVEGDKRYSEMWNSKI